MGGNKISATGVSPKLVKIRRRRRKRKVGKNKANFASLLTFAYLVHNKNLILLKSGSASLTFSAATSRTRQRLRRSLNIVRVLHKWRICEVLKVNNKIICTYTKLWKQRVRKSKDKITNVEGEAKTKDYKFRIFSLSFCYGVNFQTI